MKIQLKKYNKLANMEVGDFIVLEETQEVLLLVMSKGVYSLINASSGYAWYTSEDLDVLLDAFLEIEDTKRYRIVKKDCMLLQEI